MSNTNPELEIALSKVRTHKASSLEHQKAPANLLVSLEETFEEQNAERTPAAYFAGLLTTLETTVQGDPTFGGGDLLPAELYLLALVGPFIPHPVIRAHANTILSLTSPLWALLHSHAPPLRSQLSLYGSIFQALDVAQLELQGVGQSFATVLQLTLDPRPKIRKKAAETIRDVLASPPTPLVRHPYGARVGEWTINALKDANALKQKGSRGDGDDATSAAIHLLQFLRPVLPYLPSITLPTITTLLLSLPRLGNPFLSQSAYGVLSDLFSIPDDPDSPRNLDVSIADTLQAIVSSPPLKTDTALIQPWVEVVGKTMLVFGSVDPENASAELSRIWRTLYAYLESPSTPIRQGTAAALANITRCISQDFITEATTTDKAPLKQMIGLLHKSIESLPYAHAIPEILAVTSALTTSLSFRPGGHDSSTAAEHFLMPTFVTIADLRVKKDFEHKEAADGALQSAMSVIGPQALLSALPLNLEPADRAAGREPRAFLLPMLAHPHPSPLGHFIEYFVPLTERMFDLQQRADAEGRAAEAKLWSVLVAQVWNGLSAYCYRTPDLSKMLTPQFAQMLSQLLYHQAELRPSVLKALKVVVESNASTDSDSANDAIPLTDEKAAENLAFLRTQSESWFAVLFNVFGSVGRDGQGLVGEVIRAWSSISDQKEMSKTCKKVVHMLNESHKKLSAVNAHERIITEQRQAVASMQDILILLIPYLSSSDAQTVLNLCLKPDMLGNKDNGIQKRAYKLMGKVLAADKLSAIDAESLLETMDANSDSVLAAAKKDRMVLLKALFAHLPNSSLHVIPSFIPEAILGTKEPSEKARAAAFDLILTMGYKMKEGGTVKRAKLSGMDEDNAAEVPASLQEYLTMLAGGLAGASATMISATVTAISRLIFEFKDDITIDMHTEIFLTFLEYLKAANREIVKPTLGFVKLFIHTQPPSLVTSHLPTLVPILLRWSHDHKNHFKEKVRHIFERLINRCGWDAVYAAAGSDEGGAKFLIGTKKRKDRAKRRKAAWKVAADEDEEGPESKAATGDAFEDVVYGSESEEEDSEDDERPKKAAQGTGVGEKKGKIRDRGARLRVDDEEPMDLLHDANTRITHARKDARRPDEKTHFKTDTRTGKILLHSDDSSDEEGDDAKAKVNPSPTDANARLAGAAYHETLISVDGFTRDARGRVKFHKDTKKRRRDAETDGQDNDVEMADLTSAPAATVPAGRNKKAKKSKPVKVGQEFKAKKAGGDVKKGGLDPYAYVSLSRAAKGGRGKGGQKMSVTGKR